MIKRILRELESVSNTIKSFAKYFTAVESDVNENTAKIKLAESKVDEMDEEIKKLHKKFELLCKEQSKVLETMESLHETCSIIKKEAEIAKAERAELKNSFHLAVEKARTEGSKQWSYFAH